MGGKRTFLFSRSRSFRNILLEDLFFTKLQYSLFFKSQNQFSKAQNTDVKLRIPDLRTNKGSFAVYFFLERRHGNSFDEQLNLYE